MNWQGEAGKRYQVLASSLAVPGTWLPVGQPIVATASLVQYPISGATNGWRFYRIQALP